MGGYLRPLTPRRMKSPLILASWAGVSFIPPLSHTVTTDRKGTLHISMNITGAVINATVDISIYPGTGNAYATVSPNFNSQNVRLEGTVVPYSSSRIVEGMSI